MAVWIAYRRIEARGDSPLFGVPLFDELEQPQRIVLLAQISLHFGSHRNCAG